MTRTGRWCLGWRGSKGHCDGGRSHPARLPVGLASSRLSPLAMATTLSGHVSPHPGPQVSCSVIACLPSAPPPCTPLPISASLSLCSIPSFPHPSLPVSLSSPPPPFSPSLCLWVRLSQPPLYLSCPGWSTGSPAAPLPASSPPWSLNQPSPALPLGNETAFLSPSGPS